MALTTVQRSAVLLAAFLVGGALSVFKPSPQQFSQQVWQPALIGMKAELEERREQSALYKLLSSALTVRFPGLLDLLKAGKDGELNRLPDYWMEHTTAQNWILVSYFRYDEAACFSDYLGVAGSVINIRDGCEVERYRTAGQ